MRISPNGIELIKRFEGLELESYVDPVGVWTIGYGHTETAGPDQKITEREAEQLLMQDLRPRERAVESLASVPLNQNEFDALVSFVYNVGQNAFRGSTARRRLNRNDRMGAADALTWWNKGTVNGVLVELRGLTRRRAAERALFLTPEAPISNSTLESARENTRITPVEDAPRRGRLAESRTIQGATVAGGAGAAASTMGRDSADELDELETNIENGRGLTDEADAMRPVSPREAEEDTAPPVSDETVSEETASADPASDDPASDQADTDETGDVPSTDTTSTEATGAETENTETDDLASNDGLTDDSMADDSMADDGETVETIGVDGMAPSKHEKHSVDSQIQLALLILILLSVVYIIYARIEDWFTYRR